MITELIASIDLEKEEILVSFACIVTLALSGTSGRSVIQIRK